MIPTPGPTRTPAVAVGLDLGMSGMTCDDYGEPEEMVVNKALETSIPGTDSSSSFSEHVCTDVTSRRALLSSSVSIAVTASIVIADYANETGNDALVGDDNAAIQNVDASSVIAAVTTTITSAVTSGNFSSAMADAATNADDDLAAAATVDFTAVTATSVAVSTVSPTPSPTPMPSTAGPTLMPSTPGPTTSKAPTPSTAGSSPTLAPSSDTVLNGAAAHGGDVYRALLVALASTMVLRALA